MPRMQNHTQFRNPFVNFIDEFLPREHMAPTQGAQRPGAVYPSLYELFVWAPVWHCGYAVARASITDLKGRRPVD